MQCTLCVWTIHAQAKQYRRQCRALGWQCSASGIVWCDTCQLLLPVNATLGARGRADQGFERHFV